MTRIAHCPHDRGAVVRIEMGPCFGELGSLAKVDDGFTQAFGEAGLPVRTGIVVGEIGGSGRA
jgi:hypothetical protein